MGAKRIYPTFHERLWARIDKSVGPNACWLWQGAVGTHGYGVIGTADKQTITTHRAVYLEVVGPIPAGRVLRHTCHTRRCNNPAHLQLGTHQDNMNDMVAAGRQTSGARNSRAKLTDNIVHEIRWLNRQGFGSAVLAEEFNMTQASLTNIIHRHTWRHI